MSRGGRSFFVNMRRRLGCLMRSRTRRPVASHTFTNLKSYVVVERAGMGFLVHDTQFRQQIENDVRFYFELASQLIDADFTHTVEPQRKFFVRRQGQIQLSSLRETHFVSGRSVSSIVTDSLSGSLGISSPSAAVAPATSCSASGSATSADSSAG